MASFFQLPKSNAISPRSQFKERISKLLRKAIKPRPKPHFAYPRRNACGKLRNPCSGAMIFEWQDGAPSGFW
jgi:hypothetical protein